MDTKKTLIVYNNMPRLNSLIYSTLGQFPSRDYAVVVLQSDQTGERQANLETLLSFLGRDDPTVLLLVTNATETPERVIRFDSLLPVLRQRKQPVFVFGSESLRADLVYSIRYRILKLNRPTELQNVRSTSQRPSTEGEVFEYPFVESIGEDSSSNTSPTVAKGDAAASPRCYIKLEYDRQRDKTAVHRDFGCRVTVLTFEITRHHPYRVMNLINLFLKESDLTLKEFCDKCIIDENERPRLQASFALDLDDTW